MTTQTARNARDRILSAAHDLFYQDGIRATGVDRIIKAAGVTKVTFYRHFPAKNALILAFLEYRHTRWINWFVITLQEEMTRSGSLQQALPATLKTWFMADDFHGCAFINTAAEMACSLPETLNIIQRHKAEMTQAVAKYLPDPAQAMHDARKIALMIDGAIVLAQRAEQPDDAVALLQDCLADHFRH